MSHESNCVLFSSLFFAAEGPNRRFLPMGAEGTAEPKTGVYYRRPMAVEACETEKG